jgi:hypothetical protein
MARSVDRGLTRQGLDADVVQRAYLLMLTRPAGHFDRSRSDGVTGYLKNMTRLAARDVRAQFARPGTRTRERAAERDAAITVNDPVSLRITTMPEDTAARELADEVAVASVISSMILDGLGAGAPSWLRRVLALIVEGLTLTEASAAVGQSRYAVRRAVDRWAKPVASGLVGI